MKNINYIYNLLICCNHACYCVSMVSVTSASFYVMSLSHYQSRSSMYIWGLIPWNPQIWSKQFRLLRYDESLGPWLHIKCLSKTLVRLCECTGWSEALLVHIPRYTFCCVLAHNRLNSKAYLSRDMWFPTMWHFDMNRPRRTCAASRGVPAYTQSTQLRTLIFECPKYKNVLNREKCNKNMHHPG